ncbi:MAG TPA: four helix bundle protein, partial [Vicinamibacterales bacterium]
MIDWEIGKLDWEIGLGNWIRNWNRNWIGVLRGADGELCVQMSVALAQFVLLGGSMSEVTEELKIRTMRFALDVCAVIRQLPFEEPGPTVKRQLAKASTGVAFNYRSSCRSRSHTEFTARIQDRSSADVITQSAIGQSANQSPDHQITKSPDDQITVSPAHRLPMRRSYSCSSTSAVWRSKPWA